MEARVVLLEAQVAQLLTEVEYLRGELVDLHERFVETFPGGPACI